MLKSSWSFSRVNGSLSNAAYLLILSSAFSYILIKLQNYSLCQFLIKFFEVPKSGKTTTKKSINKSLKKQLRYIYWVYQDSRPLDPQREQWIWNLTTFSVKTFSVKTFSLKTKPQNIATIERIKLLLFKNTVYGSFRQGITMFKCKTKAIQEDLGIFKHNETCSWIIQTYSGIFRTLCNPGMLTVIYPESWHIQHQKHIQNLGIFTTLVYSEPRHI